MSDLFVVGLSHHTAPVEVRERVAFRDDELDGAVRRLAGLPEGAAQDLPPAVEAMLLSTCNRVEAYLVAPDATTARARAAAFLAGDRGVDRASLDPHLYFRAGDEGVRHLYRVAASLDSAIVGEPQILGQVKDAWERARRAGSVGPLLGQLVPRAFACAKRVRTETAIARTSASVAAAAVDLGRRVFGDLAGREVLVVGAGKMGDLATRHLLASGCARLLIANRTLARAEELAARLNDGAGRHVAEPFPITEVPALLVRADIVLCSTGAARPVITRDMVQRAMKARRGRWLCIVDMAVPRDVEPAVGDLGNVYLHDIDALTAVVDEHLTARRREAEAGERIVDEELLKWEAARQVRGVVPTIKSLREHFTTIARAEAQRALGKLAHLSDKERREVQALADAIVNKLLHAPMVALKRDADPAQLVVATRALFDLRDDPAAPEVVVAALAEQVDSRVPAPLVAGAAAGERPR